MNPEIDAALFEVERHLDKLKILLARERPLAVVRDSRAMAIVRAVSDETGVSASDMLGEGREAHVVRARWMAMFIIRERLGMGQVVIGNLFNRDHGAVSGALKQMPDRIKNDRELERQVNHLRAMEL